MLVSDHTIERGREVLPDLPFDRLPLALTGAETTNVTLTFTGGSVAIDWGDGSPHEQLASGVLASHTYSGYTGDATLTLTPGTSVTVFASSAGKWSFTTTELAAAFPDLVSFTASGAGLTITGGVADLPTGLTYLDVAGSNTLSGGVADLPTGLTYLNVTGSCALSYSSGGSWGALKRLIRLEGSGLATSGEIDQLLIDINAAAVSPVSEKSIDMDGPNAARTSASDAAVTALQGRGWTVVTNT